MSRTLAVVLGVGAGCLVGMQAPINSRLGKTIGTVQAAAPDGGVLVAERSGEGSAGEIARHHPLRMANHLRTCHRAGRERFRHQLHVEAGLFGDRDPFRFGLLGVARQQIGPARIIGLALLVVGFLLVVRK